MLHYTVCKMAAIQSVISRSGIISAPLIIYAQICFRIVDDSAAVACVDLRAVIGLVRYVQINLTAVLRCGHKRCFFLTAAFFLLTLTLLFLSAAALLGFLAGLFCCDAFLLLDFLDTVAELIVL